MFLKRRLAGLAAVTAMLAVGAPAASTSAAILPVALPANPSCPANYNGPTNLATGCPWWLMS
jgi:hypothetical protein